MRGGSLTTPILRKPREYPFDDLAPYVKSIIVRAIEAAWQQIVEGVDLQGGALWEEGEPTLTARLEHALNDIRTEPDHPSGFSASQFQHVIRESAVTSFDDRSLEKRPDLTFRLITAQPGMQSADCALFVECKIVGPKHPIRNYCAKGISRFVRGEYAWAMPCGMMIGYAWEGFSVEGRLWAYLKSNGSRTGLRTLPRRVPELSTGIPVYESRHGRKWLREGKNHGDISILHLWLPLRQAA